MKRILTLIFTATFMFGTVLGQTPQKPREEVAPEDVIRITTNLVQTDVVVTDKNDQPINDLKLEDFELYDNGKKQDIKFMDFVSVDTGRRREGDRAGVPAGVDLGTSAGLTAKEVRRVMAFVVDDLTIPDADLFFVRDLLLDFVNNKMREGDLVAIVRTVGGRGLLQQFTSDRDLLRRAIRTMYPIGSAYKATLSPDPGGFTSMPTAPTSDDRSVDLTETNTQDISGPTDDTNRLFRGLTTLTTANLLIDSLKEIPGHKNMLIISGGIPIFESTMTGTTYSTVSYLLNQLSDNATRAGVTVNALDPRGLKATPGVRGFEATPARSGLSNSIDPTFGRGGVQSDAVFGDLLAGSDEHLGLSTVTAATGGISVVNTNNFKDGLDRVLARSRAYYTLGFAPREKFDNKFHRIEIKVKRSDARVHTQIGYIAREDRVANVPQTKEEEVAAAARSPLAKRDIDITPNVTFKMLPKDNRAQLDIHMRIDAGKLHFNQTPDGKYQTSFDVVGFVLDQLGKLRGGFSETINPSLSAETYQRALREGLTYSATTEIPTGYYQVRAVVREAGTGSLGSFTRYVELPTLGNGQLAMSSLFLFGIDPGNPKPVPLQASRQFTRKQELRYAALIYNVRPGKSQLVSQLIISQGGRILFREPEQPIELGNPSQPAKIGQIALAKVQPGRYVLTLIVSDTAADKKNNPLSRSVDFVVLE